MSSVNHIYISNLPEQIRKNDLTIQLLRLFPVELGTAWQNKTLTVTVYEGKDNGPTKPKKTVATVSGIAGNVAVMNEVVRKPENVIQYKDRATNIVIKMDYGQNRDKYGMITKTMSPTARRGIEQLSGVTHRKVIQVFNANFWKEINVKVFDGKTKTFVYLNTADFELEILKAPGNILFHQSEKKLYSTIIRYDSILTTLQAIRFLNNNTALSNPVAQFTDQNKLEKSVCYERKGLGIDGILINIKGIIQLSMLDSSILNKQIITSSYETYCWRCKKPFIFNGIEVNLNFLAGTCYCQYISSLDVLDSNRAYHWPGENYTRLSVGLQDKSFIIVHNPMKSIYSTRVEFESITLPILQEEWKYSSREFKKNFCYRKLVSSDRVEVITNASGKEHQVFAIQVIVPKTKFWAEENFLSISKVTMDMQILQQNAMRNISCARKGKVLDIRDQNYGSLCLFIQLHLDLNTSPSLDQSLRIVPKQHKEEYNTTKHLVRKFAEKDDVTSLLTIFLNNGASRQWEIVENSIPIKGHRMITDSKLMKMWKHLNAEQMKAVSNASKYRFSVVHGPPGTGKTHTGAALVTQLITHENGTILVCTPSNVAATGFASQIEKVSRRYELKVGVLRIFSKTRERSSLKTCHQASLQTDTNSDCSYAILHEEVKKLMDKRMDTRIQQIIKKINDGLEYKLTKDEKDIYESEVERIELDVMKNFDVFVCTIGALCDKRVERWNKKLGPTRQILTVVMDEVGQVKVPSTLAAFITNPRRIVLIGDHLQLPPTILSYSASVAGLQRSLMDWITLRGDTNQSIIPWTTLLEQHRMAPAIRKIVSAVTYQNKLKDAAVILSRELDIPPSIYEIIPELKVSPIVVFNHKYIESKVDTTYKNDEEANKVIELVQKLSNSGIPPSKITILTFYEGQRSLIEKKLQSKETAVLNVDGFPGRENSIVILSFVRSNQYGNIGFTSVTNRLNVAISRAKHILLITCNFETLIQYKSQAWKTITGELLRNNNFVNE